jgi:Double zinc ribbon
MPDELDRLFELLVEALARETRVAVPFPAADVYERLVPYRSNRSRLKVATHQDYEMAVLRLLSGERGYVRLDGDDVREAMQREIAAPNPDPAYFRSFPDARVMVNGRAAERFLLGEQTYAPRAEPGGGDEEEEQPISWTGENPVPPSASGSHFSLVEDPDTPHAKQCQYCGGMLPGTRKVNFCPHCGQPPSGDLKCPACGSEVDVGWAYCISCGRATGFE